MSATEDLHRRASQERSARGVLETALVVLVQEATTAEHMRADRQRDKPAGTPGPAPSFDVSGLLSAARILAQSDRVVAQALGEIERATERLIGIATDTPATSSTSTPERFMAAGMGLAVAQHTLSKASKTHVDACFSSIEKDLQAARRGRG